MLNWDGGSSSGDGLAEKNGRETEQEDGRCLTIMKTLEMGAIIFPFFIKPPTSQHQRPVEDKGQISGMFATESGQNAKSCLFHISSILPVNHIQMSQGSWQHMEQCLGSEVFSLVFSHTIPSAVDPCWTFPMGCSLGHILSKAERAADSQDQERCQERCISDNSTLHAGIFYTCLISLVSTSCSVQYQKSHKRSGWSSQIMWKWGI